MAVEKSADAGTRHCLATIPAARDRVGRPAPNSQGLHRLDAKLKEMKSSLPCQLTPAYGALTRFLRNSSSQIRLPGSLD
jgi:hypothetical protein